MTTTVADRTRGAHILEAAVTVIAEGGQGSLTMRSVAAAADVSLAQVQYYFRSRAELVAAAFDHATAEFLDALQAIDGEETTLARLRSVLWLWLPLDTARERRARTWIAYAATAAVDAEVAAASARLDVELRSWLHDELAALQRNGELRSAITASHAPQLLAMLDGVVLQCLALPVESRAALAEQTIGTWLTEH